MQKTLKTVAAAAIAGLALTGCNPATDESSTPLDQVRPQYSADMQAAINGYMATHELAREDLRAGLVIPWVAAVTDRYPISGYLVATGNMSPAGCPVFNAVTLNDNAKYTWRSDNILAMCPN